MRQVAAIGAVALAAVMAGASFAGRAGGPTLTAKVTSAGIEATWSKLPSQDSYVLYWNNDNTPRPIGTIAPCKDTPQYDCITPSGSWPYPQNGTPLDCNQQVSATHYCTGYQNLSDPMTKATIPKSQLVSGTVYYVQVLVEDHCEQSSSCPVGKRGDAAEYYSNAYRIEYKATATGGGASTGSTGGTQTQTGTAAAKFSAPVTVRHKNGDVEKVTGPAAIQPFDKFTSGGSAVTIGLNGSKLTLAPATSVTATIVGSDRFWDVTAGKLYHRGYVPMSANGVSVKTTTGPFTATVTVSGGTEVIRNYKGEMELTRGSTVLATLEAGQQATIKGSGKPAVTKLKPEKKYWP